MSILHRRAKVNHRRRERQAAAAQPDPATPATATPERTPRRKKRKAGK